jgi:hypothetical protein
MNRNYYKQYAVAFLVVLPSVIKCADLDEADTVVIANAFVADDTLGYRTLAGYVALKGEPAVQKAFASNTDLQGLIDDYSWDKVAKQIKQYQGGAALTEQQIKDLPKEMTAFGEKLKAAQATDQGKTEPAAQRQLLTNVLAGKDSSALKSVQNLRKKKGSDEKMDNAWNEAMANALRVQFQ